jgi:hypothetical protein
MGLSPAAGAARASRRFSRRGAPLLFRRRAHSVHVLGRPDSRLDLARRPRTARDERGARLGLRALGAARARADRRALSPAGAGRLGTAAHDFLLRPRQLRDHLSRSALRSRRARERRRRGGPRASSSVVSPR